MMIEVRRSPTTVATPFGQSLTRVHVCLAERLLRVRSIVLEFKTRGRDPTHTPSPPTPFVHSGPTPAARTLPISSSPSGEIDDSNAEAHLHTPTDLLPSPLGLCRYCVQETCNFDVLYAVRKRVLNPKSPSQPSLPNAHADVPSPLFVRST